MNNPPSSVPTPTASRAGAIRPDAEQPSAAPRTWVNQDRRKQRRFSVARSGKLFRRATQQFTPVKSRDLSFSGALLEAETPRPFAVGELIDVGIAMGKESLVPSSCMVQAIVVRTTPIDKDRQAVAVRYVNSVAAQLTT